MQPCTARCPSNSPKTPLVNGSPKNATVAKVYADKTPSFESDSLDCVLMTVECALNSVNQAFNDFTM